MLIFIEVQFLSGQSLVFISPCVYMLSGTMIDEYILSFMHDVVFLVYVGTLI